MLAHQKIAILGGSGFIGRNLLEYLSKNASDLISFGRKEVALPGVINICCDLKSATSFADNLADCETLIHSFSATIPGTLASLEDEKQVNLTPFLELLDALDNTKIKKLIFISSGGTVYGNPVEDVFVETSPTNPIPCYGQVKLMMEQALMSYAKNHPDFSYIILRLTNPYGPYQFSPSKKHGVISTFLDKIMKGEKITLFGDGTISRDYIYINDVCDLVERILKTDAKNQIFNACTGVEYDLNEIIRTIELVTGLKSDVEKLPSRDFDVKSCRLSNTKAMHWFDWKPIHDLNEGISILYNFLIKTK